MIARKFTLLIGYFIFCSNAFAQNTGDEYADSAYVYPDSLCLTCNGSVWKNVMNATIPPFNYSRSYLLQYNQCNQDTCFYTREFRYCNYGFSIPLNATIDSMRVHISQGTFTTNAIKDSVVQLMKNHSPTGNNYAYPYPWNFYQTVYYPTGLYGTTWTSQEINDPGFGLIVRAKNISNDTASARIASSRIVVYYRTSVGIFSQSLEQNLFSVYPNPSNGSFTVDFDQSIKEIWLTDLLGNIIFKRQTNYQTQFKIDNLSSGSYILTAINRDGRTINKKVISCP